MDDLRSGWKRVKFGEVVRHVKDKVDPAQLGLERYIAGEHMDTDELRIRRWGDIGGGHLGPAFHMRFSPGHVLYGSRRTYLRKVAVAHFDGICANTTFVLEAKDPATLLPELLPFIMQTEAFHEHSRRESKGSVNPYVNFSDLQWYEFALPPMEEQLRIANELRALESAKNDAFEALSTKRFRPASASARTKSTVKRLRNELRDRAKSARFAVALPPAGRPHRSAAKELRPKSGEKPRERLVLARARNFSKCSPGTSSLVNRCGGLAARLPTGRMPACRGLLPFRRAGRQ